MLTTSTNRQTYAGNGVTTAFPFPYWFFSTNDIKVYLRDGTTKAETLQTNPANYSVSGTATNGVYLSGGTINFVTPPATGQTVVIFRDPVQTQDLNLIDNQAFPAGDVMNRLDKLTAFAQRLAERVSRALSLTDAQTDAFTPTIPTTFAANPSTALIINAAGNGLDIGPTVTQISNAQTYAANAAASASAAAASAATALLLSPNIVGTRAAPQNITAGVGIAFSGSYFYNIWFIQGNAANVVVSAIPQIAAGTVVGQRLSLIGRNDSQTVKLADGNGLSLVGDWFAFAGSTLALIWDGAVWLEERRT